TCGGPPALREELQAQPPSAWRAAAAEAPSRWCTRWEPQRRRGGMQRKSGESSSSFLPPSGWPGWDEQPRAGIQNRRSNHGFRPLNTMERMVLSFPRSDAFVEEIRREFPAFRIVPKSESVLQRAIDVALKVLTFGRQSAYLTRYHTVLG